VSEHFVQIPVKRFTPCPEGQNNEEIKLQTGGFALAEKAYPDLHVLHMEKRPVQTAQFESRQLKQVAPFVEKPLKLGQIQVELVVGSST
jgi:hypothetical protein